MTTKDPDKKPDRVPADHSSAAQNEPSNDAADVAAQEPAQPAKSMSSYVSLLAVILSVFFSGIYLRGEAARKREVKQALDEVRSRQAQIAATVEEINRYTAERDQILLSRIDSARSYIDILNAEETLASEKIERFGENIQELQVGIDSTLTLIARSQGFDLPPPSVPADQ